MPEVLFFTALLSLLGLVLVVKLLHPLLRRAGLNSYTIWSATLVGPVLALVFAYVFNTYPGVSVGRLLLSLILALLFLAAVLAYFEPAAARVASELWLRRRTLSPSEAATSVSVPPIRPGAVALEAYSLPVAATSEQSLAAGPAVASPTESSASSPMVTARADAPAVRGGELVEEEEEEEGGCFLDCMERGFFYKERGNWKEALVNFQRGLRITLDTETRMRLITEVALAKSALGRWEEAIADLSRELLLLGPDGGHWREELSSLIRFIRANHAEAARREVQVYLGKK